MFTGILLPSGMTFMPVNYTTPEILSPTQTNIISANQQSIPVPVSQAPVAQKSFIDFLKEYWFIPVGLILLIIFFK